jgi:hypothetical protein
VVSNAPFADELVSLVLDRGDVARLRAERVSSHFGDVFTDVARNRGVVERLDIV